MKKYKIRPGSVADKVTRHAIPASLSVAMMVTAMGSMVVTHNCNQVDAMQRVENDPVIASAVTAQKPEEANRIKYYNIPLSLEMQNHITEKCAGTGIAPTLIYAMIAVESGYQADAIGDAGKSKGLMQIQQRWHETDMRAVGATNLLDMYDNVNTGIYILANLLDTGNGECWAVTAYNAGPAAAERYMRSGKVSPYFEKIKQKQAEIESEVRYADIG